MIRKQKVESSRIATDQRAASDTATDYSGFLKKVVGIIQGLSGRLPRKCQLIILSLFCVGAGSLSFYLVANSIMNEAHSSLNVKSIVTSPFIGRSGDESTSSGMVTTEEEYEKIKRFRVYMDTLARSPAGKKVYDSILNTRPGLMDSVLILEKLYQSQLKK